MHPTRRQAFALTLSAGLFWGVWLHAESDRCAACGGTLGDAIYTVVDQVTQERKEICHSCATWPDRCFICGLPARKNSTRLSDGRFLCARDAKDAVLDADEAERICEEVKGDLDKLFSRFLTFPGGNVEIGIVDRVNLLAFKIPGNDFECPNLLGYFRPQTNHGQLKYSISLLSALPRAEFKAVCAHEYTHAWVYENVSNARRKTLSSDAHEGFCELVAFLLLDAKGEEEGKRRILRNTYTRGQIDAFIEAERRCGFNDVVDWVKYGVDSRLDRNDLSRVRTIRNPPPRPQTAQLDWYGREPAPAPATMTLRGFILTQTEWLALINDCALTEGEIGRIRVGKTNLLVRCLSLGENSVRIQNLASGEIQELRLKPHKP
jgi:hypothetical protein